MASATALSLGTLPRRGDTWLLHVPPPSCSDLHLPQCEDTAPSLSHQSHQSLSQHGDVAHLWDTRVVTVPLQGLTGRSLSPEDTLGWVSSVQGPGFTEGRATLSRCPQLPMGTRDGSPTPHRDIPSCHGASPGQA